MRLGWPHRGAVAGSDGRGSLPAGLAERGRPSHATGAALPLVLLVLLLIAAAALAASFAATLDASAARSFLDQVSARAVADGALALAVGELVALTDDGLVPEPPFSLGPWAALGMDVTVLVTDAGAYSPPGGAEAEAALALLARATVGRAAAESSVTVVMRPYLGLLSRYRN